MKFTLACGHTRKISPWDRFDVIRREPCMRCHLEAKARVKAQRREDVLDARRGDA